MPDPAVKPTETTPRPSSTNRRAAILFFALVGSGVCLAWPVAGTLEAAIDGPSQRRRGPCVCAEDRDPSLVSRRLRVAWLKAFDGEPPDDTDLGAYQDATEILDCLSASEAAGP
jgi:hypothetical protein